MDFSRIRIKDLVFLVKDAVARNLANAASNTANSAAANATIAMTAAQEAEVTANAADAKAEQALAKEAPVQSVNGKTGAVVLNASDVGAKPSSYEAPVSSVNNKTGAVVLTASDVGAKPSSYEAPVQSVNGETGDVAIDIPSPATTNPLMDGTVSQGSSDNYARADHRHPKDTSKANVASPTFTGTPKAPTAASGTNTEQIATTAFVSNAVKNTTVTEYADSYIVTGLGTVNVRFLVIGKLCVIIFNVATNAAYSAGTTFDLLPANKYPSGITPIFDFNCSLLARQDGTLAGIGGMRMAISDKRIIYGPFQAGVSGVAMGGQIILRIE